MNQVLFNVGMFAVVIAIFAVIALAFVGALLLIGKLFWAIYLRFEASQRLRATRLWSVMEEASTMPLAQAVMLLRGAGMYYDNGAKWRGKQLRLPKCFWRSAEYYFNAPLKARALVTIATAAMENKNCSVARNIADGILESLASQAKRTPTRVIAVVGLLAQLVAQNTKLAVLSSQLDNIGTYSA